MARSFLILHGLGNRRPPRHWEFLLAAKLVERGHEVRYPDLPDTDAPQLEAWLAVVRDELDTLSASEVTVVCHSLSCLLWFHAASRGALPVVDRVLLAAPPATELIPDTAASFRLDGSGAFDRSAAFDAAAVKASANELTIVCSDNDWFSPEGPTLYSSDLGITPIVIPGAGHLTPDDGYGSWPFVLDWCLQD